ncbi:MAG: hypothetical protein KOO60_11915 [Gemmatimonadales bacterium]|nr:hypothetical protein [Gemmatimonadales bacterium]
MKRAGLIAGFITGLALLLSNDAVAEPASILVPFQIQDQHDALHTDRRFAGAALLAVWGDRKGSEFMKPWSLLLTNSLQSEIQGYRVRRLNVGHVEGAPFFVKGRIKNEFRQDWPEPILLDWSGLFDRTYDCADDSCTILLFDRRGELIRRWTVTDLEPGSLDRILEASRQAARADK